MGDDEDMDETNCLDALRNVKKRHVPPVCK